MMLANAFDGRCIASGGPWCTAAGLWDTDTGRFITLGLVLCIIAFVTLSLRIAVKWMNAMTTPRQNEAPTSLAERLAERRKKHAEVEE